MKTASCVNAKPLCLLWCGLIVVLLISASHPCLSQGNDSHSEEIRQHLLKAQGALSVNSPDAAQEEFEAILAIDQKNATALANLGALAFVRGDYSVAAQHLRQALQSEPTLSKARALLALSEKRMGDPSAQELLEKSFQEVQDSKIRVQVGMDLADAYYQSGNLERASETVGNLLQFSADDPDVLYMAQRVYQEMAEGALNKLTVLAPKSARMQQVIAEHLVNAGNTSDAIKHYRMALQLNPNLPGVRYEIGECIMQLSTEETSLAEAESEFARAIANEGDSAAVEVRLGMIAALRSQPDRAYEHYERAYTLNSNNADAELGLAQVLLDRNQSSEAIRYLEKVVNADPMNTQARYRLAMACKRAGLSDESTQEMKLFRESKALKDQIENVYAQMNRPQRLRSIP